MAPRPINDLPLAVERKETLAGLLEGSPLAVFLDFDGTLTPVVEHPDMARLSTPMREAVRALAEHCSVAVVSGRDRSNVEEKVGLEGLIYAGSHGFDIAAPGGRVFEACTEYRAALDRASQKLGQALSGLDGALIETKRCALAVHYRQAAGKDVRRIKDAVRAAVAGDKALRLASGKKVYEILPAIDWDKGKAVRWILEDLAKDGAAPVPVYMGDDRTDEDAFSEIIDTGAGMVVMEDGETGGERLSNASFRLRGTDEVAEIIRFLGDLSAEKNLRRG